MNDRRQDEATTATTDDATTDAPTPLTRRQRWACVQAWIDGKDHRTIAAAAGVSPAAVTMRLYRARKRLLAAGIAPPPPGRRKPQRRTVRRLGDLPNV